MHIDQTKTSLLARTCSSGFFWVLQLISKEPALDIGCDLLVVTDTDVNRRTFEPHLGETEHVQRVGSVDKRHELATPPANKDVLQWISCLPVAGHQLNSRHVNVVRQDNVDYWHILLSSSLSL